MNRKFFALIVIAAAVASNARAVVPVIGLDRASVSSAGTQANSDSFATVVSADGRYVAFDSNASNLDPSVLPREGRPSSTQSGGFPYYVYVRDRATGTTQLVSIGMNGELPNGRSQVPAISDDGRFVAFGSVATNLTPDGATLKGDVFLRDRIAGTTVRVSVNYNGVDTAGGGYPSLDDNIPNWISGDGRYVLFRSYARLTATADANGHIHLFRRDTVSNKTELVDLAAGMTSANNDAADGSISADGRFVLFRSAASDIIPGENQFGADIIVLRDMTLGTNSTFAPSGCIDQTSFAPEYHLSRNAHFAIFTSNCSTFVPGQSPNDHWFVQDIVAGKTSIFHMRDDGNPDANIGNASISNSGRYAVAWTQEPNVISGGPPQSGLTVGHIYLRDRTTAKTFLISARVDNGVAGNDASLLPVQTPNGLVAFVSAASNLVDGDTNAAVDVFVAMLDNMFAAGFE